MKKQKPVSSGNGTIAKATAKNPHAKGWEGQIAPLPGKPGSKDECCPKISTLD